MKLLKKWQGLSLFTRIMVGFALGIAAGFILGDKASHVAFLGTILTRLLTMVVAPLVLGLLICAAAAAIFFAAGVRLFWFVLGGGGGGNRPGAEQSDADRRGLRDGIQHSL